MKKILLSAALVIVFLSFALAVGKDKISLKEKIESYQEVPVYFILSEEIIDKDDQRRLQQLKVKQNTVIRTPMPEIYANAELQAKVVALLNEGLEVTQFVIGDVNTLPKAKNSKYNGRDLADLADGFYATLEISGDYTRLLDRKEVDGKSVFDASNYLMISSRLYFHEKKDGKMKVYGGMMGEMLGYATSETKHTDKYESLSYMESNFPATSLYDEYEAKMYELTSSYTKKKLKKHNKIVSKRK